MMTVRDFNVPILLIIILFWPLMTGGIRRPWPMRGPCRHIRAVFSILDLMIDYWPAIRWYIGPVVTSIWLFIQPLLLFRSCWLFWPDDDRWNIDWLVWPHSIDDWPLFSEEIHSDCRCHLFSTFHSLVLVLPTIGRWGIQLLIFLQ